MDKFAEIVTTVDGFLWGWFMIILLLGTHVFMTIRTKGIQIKAITRGIKLSVTKDPDAEGEISQFGALATALAATIGTGNIVGVGTAVFLGGPGAVFWCWITGVLGIATKYAESLIAVKYRVKTEDGRMLGGAMFALERGLKMRWLGVAFALLAGVASFGIGDAVQVNAIAEVANANFGIPNWVVGVVICAITAIVVFGGIKSISRVCEMLVPFMAVFYVIGCIIICCMNYDFIVPAIGAIVKMAFVPGAVAGGLVGSGIMLAMRYGIARGLFSNESGMGSAPIAAAAAQTRNPVRQALVSSTGTFWDTVVVCLMTGLTIVSSIMKNPDINVESVENGGQLTSLAFQQIHILGPVILTAGIVTFAYSTILGWEYYGERAIEYVMGKSANVPYRIIYLAVIVIAPITELGLVWDIADALNALMAIPNLVAVLGLSGVIAAETNKYINDLDAKCTDKLPTWHRGMRMKD